MNAPWVGWSADDWVRHYAGPSVYMAGALPTMPVEAMAYRNMWDPFVKQVVAAANACADAYDDATDARGIGGPPYQGPSLKPIAALHRVNAQALLNEWNNAGNIRVILTPTTALRESQNVVLTRCNQVLENVRRDCPRVPMPNAVPSKTLQAQIIGTLEHARLIGTGVLQVVGTTAQGLLVKAEEEAMRVPRLVIDAARTEMERERKVLEKTLKWLMIGGVGVAGVLMLASSSGKKASS